MKLLPKKHIDPNEKGKRIALTAVLCVLLSLLYAVIFSFSGQDAEESSSLSLEVTEKCVETITELSGQKVDDSLKHQLALQFEKPVRKLAHFTEYAIMGALVSGLLAVWFKAGKGRFLCNIGWVSVSAAFDEFHQRFVAGRFGSPMDVLLDTAGGLFGILAAYLAGRLVAAVLRKWFGRAENKADARNFFVS